MKKTYINFLNKKQTMRKKLFLYMSIISLALLITLTLSLFAIGSITSPITRLSNVLNLQLEVFNRDINSYYDNISFESTKLSETITSQTEEYLKTNKLTFEDLENSNEHINLLENNYIKTIKEYLNKTNCSGAFVILNTSRGKQGENSKVSLYLKRNILAYGVKNKLLLYRGNAIKAKQLDISPHRKWELEFDSNLYPNFNQSLFNDIKPLEKSCKIDGIIELPKTSEKVMLLSIPIRDKNGKNYGICGYEISSDVFKASYGQPTTLKHLVCLFSKSTNNNTIDVDKGLSCGVSNGYYKSPKGILKVKKSSNKNIVNLTNEHNSYIGMTKPINIYDSKSKYEITAMIPKSDYNKEYIIYLAKIIFLIILIGVVLISGCLYFSNQYIVPIIKELEKIKQTELINSDSNFLEFEDLFEFLSKKDNEHKSSIDKLLKEKEFSQKKLKTIQKKLDKLLAENNNVIDPYEFNYFKENINSLTKSEKKIFDMYLDGKSSNDITNQLNIKISTLKFHNHNIYQKLGIKSRKQLIRLANLLEEENK